MRRLQNKKLTHLSLALFMAVSSLSVLAYTQHAHATPLATVFVRFDRMVTSTYTNGTVCAKPSTTNIGLTEGKVLVTFPTGFTVAAASNWTVDTTIQDGWPTSGTVAAWPGINTATNVTGQTVTFPSTDLASSSTTYCFNWYNATPAALQTPSSTGSDKVGTVATQTSGGSAIDSSDFATATVGNDQILVTATVPPIFSFDMPTTSDPLGTLSSSAVNHGANIAATIGTNAKNGWMVWAKSALTNGGLRSATAAYTIPSNCSSGAGSYSVLSTAAEGYNTGVTGNHSAGGSGSISVPATFDGSTTSGGGGLCGTFQTIATSNGTAVGDVLTLKNNVAITHATAAATDYTDTITVVGAGLF